MRKRIRSRLVLSLLALFLLAGAIIVPLAGSVKHSHAASGADVLILDTTVTGGSSSLEAQAATALGLSVNVVDSATWAGMTTADFASYKAIVLGDPTCTGDPSPLAPADANTSVWGPAVRGNVVVIGTDPVFHAPSQPGANTLISNGIAFAASTPGNTGAYIDLSCYYYNTSSGTPVPVLNAVDSTGFTVEGQGSCPENSHIVGSSMVVSGLSDDLLSNWGCSTHEAFDSWPSDFTVQVISKDIPSSYVAPDESSGAPYILTRSFKNQLFLFVQGIDSALSASDATSNTVPTDSFGKPGGIYQFLKAKYPQAKFRMFSYHGSDGSGTPSAYACQDTFTRHLSDYVALLKTQIKSYLSQNANTEVYLIAHSMGGAVALGLLADERINGFLKVNGGQIAGVVTLDSPLGGVKNVLHLASYFTKQYYIKSCQALQTQKLPTNSLSDLFSIFGTGSALPHGGSNSIAETLYGADFTNQEVVEGASIFSPVMTIGNLEDWIYDPQACTTFPGASDFASTEWVSDAGNNSGIYGRDFSDGTSTCPGLGQIAINHSVVFTEPSVQSAIQEFVDGNTPTALQAAPSGP